MVDNGNKHELFMGDSHLYRVQGTVERPKSTGNFFFLSFVLCKFFNENFQGFFFSYFLQTNIAADGHRIDAIL